MKQSTADKLLLKMLFFVLLSVIEPLETKMQQQQRRNTALFTDLKEKSIAPKNS